MLPQLAKNQEIFPATRDEDLFLCGVSREIPPSLLSLERVLDTLEATQEVPRHTHLHSRGTLRVPPQLKKSPGFPSSSRDEVPFLCFVRKGIRRSRRTSRGSGLNLTLERNSRGRATILKHPDVPMPSSYTSLPCTALTVTPRIDSKHDGRCDSPVAPREKATDPYANSTGNLTLLLECRRKADLHVSA